MALLMTLSILVILSLALAKSFEDRALERRHLEVSTARFQVENLGRSVLRGLIQAIRKGGYWEVANSPRGIRQIPEGAIVPLSEAAGVSRIRIRSLDHLFNLRQIYKPQSSPAKLFQQTLNAVFTARGTPYYGPNPEEVMSAINDYQDPDSDPDKHFPYGAEQYPNAKPSFQVKNAEFDLLSEVKVLPSFQQLRLTQQELEAHFRVAGNLESQLDVNSATPEEISQFIDKYTQVGPPYQNLGRLKENLVSILSKRDPMGLEPYFDHPFAKRGASVFEQELEAEGLLDQLTREEKDLFEGSPTLIQVDFQIHYQNLVRRVKCIIEMSLGRGSKSKVPPVTKLKIISYRLY